MSIELAVYYDNSLIAELTIHDKTEDLIRKDKTFISFIERYSKFAHIDEYVKE